MSNLPTVHDEFGIFDVTDLRLSLEDRYEPGDPELRLVGALIAEIERLRTESEARLRRCEIYAAGIIGIAIYEGEHGLGYETPKRMAQFTKDRIDRLGEGNE